MITDPAINPGEQRNIFVSIVTTRTLSLLRRSEKLMMIINTTRIRNTSVIRSIKGRSGNAPFDHPGRNLKMVESGIVNIADVSAAAEVVRFQKKPRRKIERTPGEIKPTYSWMNW